MDRVLLQLFQHHAQYLKSLPFASSTLTGSARDAKRCLAGVAHGDSYVAILGGKIWPILPPSVRTCRGLSQDVKSAR
jgi:hypothetical protein